VPGARPGPCERVFLPPPYQSIDWGATTFFSEHFPRPRQLVQCRAASAALKASVEGDVGNEAWRAACSAEFGLTEPCLPPRLCAPGAHDSDLSFRSAWGAWRREFSDFYDSPEDTELLRRCARCWNELKRWLRKHAPPIAASLAPGLSRSEVAALDPAARLPAAVRAIYRMHNGQPMSEGDHGIRPTPLLLDPHSEEVHAAWNGLFGGYIFYEHVVNLRMPPLEHAIKFGKQCSNMFARCMPSQERPDFPLAFGVSLMTGMGTASKMYMLHNHTGKLYVPRGDGSLMCCDEPASAGARFVGGESSGQGAAAQDPASAPSAPGAPLRDGALRWLEAYAAQLARNNFAVSPYLKDEFDWGSWAVGISLYPRLAPACAASVTRNVRIEASALFVPEKSRDGSLFFSYCMRMSIVGEGPPDSGGKAQLITRHLVFDQGPGREPVVVDGEAVIGEFPHLIAGGSYTGGQEYEYAGKHYVTEYFYASCTHMPTEKGSLSGSFRFVPGSIASPSGRCRVSGVGCRVSGVGCRISRLESLRARLPRIPHRSGSGARAGEALSGVMDEQRSMGCPCSRVARGWGEAGRERETER